MPKKPAYKLDHSPTLNTVLMVEHTLQNMDKSLFTVADIKKKLPKQVNHNTLLIILAYLEESNKIVTTIRGITWIYNTNSRLREEIYRGHQVEQAWQEYDQGKFKSKKAKKFIEEIEKW